VLCLILVPLPPGKNPFAVKLNTTTNNNNDRLCGLVVRVPAYRPREPGFFPGATTFSEK
jgi:hypothetical protein